MISTPSIPHYSALAALRALPRRAATPRLDDVCNIAIQILEQKALCQQDPDQDEDDEPLEDQAEYDSVLISSAGDLVAAFATTLCADFVQAFQTFLLLISKLVSIFFSIFVYATMLI